MKITIGQFFGLVVIGLVVVYLVSPWWGDQDQDSWITRFTGSIIEDGRDESTVTSKSEQETEYDPSGWN